MSPDHAVLSLDMRPSSHLLVASAVTLGWVSGCGCDAIGCSDDFGVELNIVPTGADFAQGTYTIVVESGAVQTFTCEVGSVRVDRWCHESEGLFLYDSKPTLRVTFPDDPSAAVTVRVSRDQTEIASRTFTPEHGTRYPSAEACSACTTWAHVKVQAS